jgi:ankyrin repeat protein
MTGTEEDFIKEVKKGLQEGSTIDSYEGFMRNTVLMCADYMGYKKAVVLFIELGADVNAENNASNTSITFACHQGHADIVKILLEEGARISCKRNQDAQGNGTLIASPLMVGVEHGHLEIVKMLLNARQGRVLDDCIDTALAMAEAKGFKEIEQLLVEAGAKKDKLYKKQVKALHKIFKAEEEHRHD